MNLFRPEIDEAVEMVDVGDIADALTSGVEDLLTPGMEGGRVVVQSNPLDAFGFLAANRRGDHFYWSGRDARVATAGVGVADRVASQGPSSLGGMRESITQRLLESPAGTRYFGGLRFDVASSPATEWGEFGAYDFVLPRLELHAADDAATFVVNVTPADASNPRRVRSSIRKLRFAEAGLSHLPRPIFRQNFPDEDGWAANIDWALGAFSRSRLAKVVLARRAILGFPDPVDPLALLDRLVASTTSCYHFLFAHSARRAFVGASPERLFKLDGSRVWAEALAGTRPRGATEGADAELCKELLMSEKDQREHVYVRQSIKEILSGLCKELHVDASASEMRLTRGRHLVSRVEGVAADGVNAADLLVSLHPTPAVGGYPTDDALKTIQQLETFDRGWYAAPVGWIGTDTAEFAVAIRSGLVEGRKVNLYSGAGIVGGSTADGEWSEIEDKIADFISVFGSNGTTAT